MQHFSLSKKFRRTSLSTIDDDAEFTVEEMFPSNMNLTYRDLINHCDAVNELCNIGLKHLEEFLNQVRKLAKIYAAAGSAMQTSLFRAGVMADDRLSCDKLMREVGLSVYQMGEKHLGFSKQIEENLAQALIVKLESLKGKKQQACRMIKVMLAEIEIKQKSMDSAKSFALGEIRREYVKDFWERMGDILKGFKPREGKHLMKILTFNHLVTRKSPSQTSTSSAIRSHFILLEEYNNLVRQYYRLKLPRILREYEIIELERTKEIKKTLKILPIILKKCLQQTGYTVDNSKFIKEDIEISAWSNFIKSNYKSDAKIFPELDEVSIDKDSEILFLKKEFNDIYNTPLKDLLTFGQNENRSIPVEVTNIVDLIRDKGIETHLIFRISGVNKDVTKLMQYVLDCDWANVKKNDIHTLCNFLKQFLQQIPGNVAEERFHSSFFEWGRRLKADKDEDNAIIGEFNQALKDFSPENADLLRYILRFLNDVAEKNEENKMTAYNLAVIFSVVFLPFGQHSNSDMNEVQCLIPFVELLIKRAKVIEWRS